MLLASFGAVDILLTADAESDVTSRLPLRPVEVLKVAHHGSADPGLAAELRVLRPRFAMIEVGRQNVYGPPEARDGGGAAPLARSDAVPDGRERPHRARDGRPADLGAGAAWSRLGVVSEQRDLKPAYLITGSDEPKVELAGDEASRPVRGRGDRARLGARDLR